MWPYYPIRYQMKASPNLVHQNEKSKIYDPTGIWETNYGIHVIVQRNNHLTGYYSLGDGIISGINEGNSLYMNWIDSYPYSTPEYKVKGYNKIQMYKDNFFGEWGYEGEPSTGNFIGKKIAEIGDGNCYRYKIKHNTIDIPTLSVNDYQMNYKETSQYFYPEICTDELILDFQLPNKEIIKSIPVEPGFSYTITVVNETPDIIVEVDNPFINNVERWDTIMEE